MTGSVGERGSCMIGDAGPVLMLEVPAEVPVFGVISVAGNPVAGAVLWRGSDGGHEDWGR